MERLFRGERSRGSSSGVLSRDLKPEGLRPPGMALVLSQSYWGQVCSHSVIISSKRGGWLKAQGSEKCSAEKIMVILKGAGSCEVDESGGHSFGGADGSIVSCADLGLILIACDGFGFVKCESLEC